MGRGSASERINRKTRRRGSRTAREAEIDELAADLWGLSKAELKDIQDSLADLME